MIAVLLSPLYLLISLYLLFRIRLWLSSLSAGLGSMHFFLPFALLFGLVALTPLLSAFSRGRLQAAARRISNFWFGILLYLLLLLLPAEAVRALLCLAGRRSILAPPALSACRTAGTLIACGAALLTIAGTCHAMHIRRVSYDVTIRKSCFPSSLKIALVADLHLGCNAGLSQVRQVADRIRSIQPDLIVYAGDMFDNDFDAVHEPEEAARILGSLQSRYGSFACWGNHDISEIILAGFTFDTGSSRVFPDPRMAEFFQNAGIRLLEDETVLIDNAFYLCGRLDASCRKKSGITRLTPKELTRGIDRRRPVLVIDHQPSQLDALSLAGADLVLSGHTHDGQLFPGNLTTRIGWKNSHGKLRIGSMTSIVTSGAGVWGPAMRIGTDSEVAEIRVTFAGDA